MKVFFRNLSVIGLIILIWCFWPAATFAQQKAMPLLRVAILDNFHAQPFSNSRYGNYYLNGIKLAAKLAAKEGINIQFKNFANYRTPLDVLKLVNSVNAWQPDVIIGPRYSGVFLLLKNSFKSTLVISPLASDDAVFKMAPNFISMTPKASEISRAVAKFMLQYYPTKGVVGVVQVNCKNCVDAANLIKKIYISHGKAFQVNYFLESQLKTMPVKSLLQGYKPGDLIYLPDMAYPAGILMARITNYLKQPTIFVGDDNWGDWKDGLAGKVKANYPYVGYRIDHWALEAETPFVQSFRQAYQQQFGPGNLDSISLIAYKTLASVIKALKTYPDICKGTFNKACVLQTYLKFYHENKSWFALNRFYIFKVDLQGEKIVGQLN